MNIFSILQRSLLNPNIPQILEELKTELLRIYNNEEEKKKLEENFPDLLKLSKLLVNELYNSP